jgi:hypothetical protein
VTQLLRHAFRLIIPTTILPIAASVLVIVFGCVAANDAIQEIFGSYGQFAPVDFADYAYVLTHLDVGAGLVLGGAISIVGLMRGADRILLVGQLLGIVSLSGVLVLEMLSLWASSAI